MSGLADLLERAREIVFRRRRARELDEEIRFHVEREAEERVRRGTDPAAARREAALALGGIEQTKERVRDAGGVRALLDLGSDVRFCLRALRRSPGFTAAAVLVLGLGLGAATAVFTTLDAVLFSALPYPGADRLVRVYEKNSETNLWNLSTVDFQAIRDQQRSFEAFGAVRRMEAAVSGAGSPVRLEVGEGTSGFFRALGLSAAKGRLIESGDESLDAAPVAVVSHAFAERSLGGSAAAVGRAITIDGVSHEVVGVLEPGRNDLAGVRAAVWSPMRMRPPTRRGPFWMRGVGLLKPGVSLASARADLAGISERIFPLWASGFQDKAARLTPLPLRDSIVGGAGLPMGLFAAAVGLVLLIAIANVATLTLVRASSREPELAVRRALGAGRMRLVRLVATESLVLTLGATVVGIGIAALGLVAIRSFAPDLPRLAEVGLGGRSAGFALLGGLASGLLVGLAPMSRLLRRRGSVALTADVRRAGVGRSTSRVQGALVVAEFALALPLLVGAGLLLNSFLRLQRVDPGFDATGVANVAIALPAARYPDAADTQRFWRAAQARLEASPGVQAAGYSTAMPPDDPGDENNFDLLDHPTPDGRSQPVAPWSAVSPEFFRVLRVPLLEGRLFSPADTESAPPVVVVSRSWAAAFLPGTSAVGRQLRSGGCTECPPTTIVGVVGDVKYLGLSGSGEAVYEPISQARPAALNLFVRSAAPTAELLRRLRESLAALDPEIPFEGEAMTARVRASLADPLRLTAVVAAFAAAALLLAALGIFGLMSYVVRQRRREIAVRVALGAEPSAVTRMIVLRGMRYALVGTGIGLAGVAAEARVLGAVLFDVRPTDPPTLAAAGLALLATAFAASWIPGRSAARTPPMEAIAAD